MAWNPFKSVVNFFVDVVETTYEAIVDAVEWTWDNITYPVIEGTFYLLGIKAETVVQVDKITTKIMGDDVSQTVKKTKVKAVIEYISSNESFFNVYMRNMNTAKAQVSAYHNFGENTYTYGLPTLTVYGKIMDLAAVKTAIDLDLTINSTVVSANQVAPLLRQKTEYYLQETAPYNYKPGQNLLSYNDSWGNSREWGFDSVVDNITDYTVSISRTATRNHFWIYGPGTVVEGDSATYTIYSSSLIPTGKSLPINLIYSGTAVDGVDFTSVAQVTMLADTDSVQVVIPTTENTAPHVARNLIVEIGSLDNALDVFDDPSIYPSLKSVDTNITDDEGVILTMPYGLVNESDTSITIPVKLENAAAGAFTVDYSFVDGTAVGVVGGGSGSDYDSTPGTLNFAGTGSEIQNIVIPITVDALDDDQEVFTVNLTNCSDPAVTLTSTSIVIWDGTSDPITGPVVLNDSFTIAPIVNKNVVMAKYHEAANPATDWYLWRYDQDLGTYPDVKAKEETFTDLDMLPVAILRKNKVNIVPEDPSYNPTNQMLKRLQMNLKDVLANIDSEDNPQPGVDDCYINFAVSPQDNNRMVSRLMFRMFYMFHVDLLLVSDTGEYKATFVEQDINNAFIWSSFEWNPDQVGDLGIPIGDYKHTVVPKSGSGEDEIPSKLIMQYQKTANSYDEIVIGALNSVTAISYGTHHNVVLKTITDSALTLPVSYHILKELTFEEQLEVYGYMLRLDFTAIEVTHLEFYETQLFADFFEFAMIVITILSLGSAGSLAAIATQLVTQYLLMELVMFVAEETGNEVLAAVVGVVAAITLGNTSGLKLGKLVNAEDLLKVTTNFAQNYSIAAGVSMEKLQGDMEEFTSVYEQRQKDFEDVEEELELNLDATFLVGLQSVNTQLYKAVQNQYDYDTIFNGPDINVSRFVDTQLSKSQII